MNREAVLRRRIKLLTWLFIVGLVISGVTAIPLRWEVDMLARMSGTLDSDRQEELSVVASWLMEVQRGLTETEAKFPFLYYGTDWLAFGHFVIAIAFVGVLRDPERNRWLFDFGLIACVLVIPYAFIFGAVRGIPVWWRLIDCSFGVLGFVPLWFCRRWAIELDHGRK